MTVNGGQNVFILTIDSLRYDYFREHSTRLANAIDGVEFTQAIATASATGHSMPALAAGVFGDTSGYELGEELTTVAECLAGAGYTNYLWSENGVFGASCNYERGFDTETGQSDPAWKTKVQSAVISISSPTVYQLAKHGYFSLVQPLLNRLGDGETYYTRAATFHEAAMEQLRAETGSLETYWIHYMDVHHPFEPPAEYLAERGFDPRRRSSLAELSSDVILDNGVGYSDEQLRVTERLYEACCEYIADELEQFVADLQREGYYDPDEDIMVITADHGESFSPDKHDMAGHTPTPSFWEELLRIPLILGLPDWESGQVDGQVSLIDVAPTVLRAAGCEVPDSYEGSAAVRPEDMVRNTTHFSVSSLGGGYAGVRHNGWKLFADRVTEGREGEQYKNPEYEKRIVLTEYGGEKERIRHVTPEEDHSPPPAGEAARQWDELHRLLREHRPGLFFDPDKGSASEDVQEQLRQLGYVDDVQ